MNKRSWVSGLAGVLLAAALGAASAQPGPGDCPGGGWGGGGHMGPWPGDGGYGPGMGGGPGYGMHHGYGTFGLAGLNLTADQQKTINKVVDANRKRQYELFGKIADLQARLRDEYQKEKWDPEAITKIYDQMNDVRRQMIRSRIDMRNQIYERLTPEQRRQFRRGWVE